MSPLRILLLEDFPDDANLIERCLQKEGIEYTAKLVESKMAYQNALREYHPNVVISDHTLPQFDSLEALKIFQEYKNAENPLAVFILVTGTVSEEFAVQIMKKGADDYILKDRLKRLPSAIFSALEKNKIWEEKRKAEEEKLQFLEVFQKSLSEISIFDSDNLLYSYANDEYLRNLGYTFDEITQMTPLDVSEDITEAEFRKLLQEIEKSRKGLIIESYAVRKNKTKYPVQIHLQLIEEQRGRKIFLANVLDITELKKEELQKEMALFIQNTFNENKSLEECLTSILQEICRINSLPAAEIWVRQFEGNGLLRSTQWIQSEHPPYQCGAKLSKKTQEEEVQKFYKNIKKELSHSAEDENELGPYNSAISYPIWLGSTIKAIIIFYSYNNDLVDEQLVELSPMVQDQLANNIKRKKQEIELTKIFDLSPEVLCVLGLDGNVKKINQSFYKILGYDKEDFDTINLAELLHPNDHYQLEEWRNATIENQEASYYQNRIRNKTGEYKWFAWSSTPFMEKDLRLLAGTDITEQKNYLEAIEERNKKLAEIAWEQSHVVRGPLARMLGCIQHIEESDEHFETMLESIKSSAYELDSIVKNIVERTETISK